MYFWPGTGTSVGIIAGDLQEHAARGTALVSLFGGMQEARTEAQTRRHALALAHRMPDGLQAPLVRFIHLDVAQQSEVVARSQAIEMPPQIACERWIAPGALAQNGRVALVGEKLDAGLLKERGFGGKAAGSLVLGGQTARRNLAPSTSG